MNLIIPKHIEEVFYSQTGGVKKVMREWKKYEFPKLRKIFDECKIEIPINVLDIGCGIGRSSALLKSYFNWESTNFYLLDGNGTNIIYGINDKAENIFYNVMKYTKEFCLINKMNENNIFLINLSNNQLIDKNIKFDLVYSFKSIGYHWPIKHYLSNVYDNVNKGGYLLFELRNLKRRYSKEERKNMERFDYENINSIDTTKYKIVVEDLLSYPALVLLRKK